MKFKFILLLLTIGCSNALFAQSDVISSGKHKNQLIELYTSEGCSSCPPADQWVSQFKDDPRLWKDIIPIAFHVDYWDRLGWKDELADNRFSQRQRHHRELGNLSQVYTPGFVVDGQEWRGFFRRKKLIELEPHEIGELNALISNQEITIQFNPLIDTDKSLLIHCAVLGFEITNEIGAGENRGRTLTHDFAVLGYKAKIVETDKNSFSLTTQLPVTGVQAKQKALVIWVSEVNDQSPLQAAGNWL